MNANVSKTNTGKLLAAVLVMAMVIAGAAVVFSEESVNAATSSESIGQGTTVNPIGESIASVGSYYAAADITISSIVDSGEVNIYVLNGASVTFPESLTNTTVTVYAATNGSASNAPTDRVAGLSIVAAAEMTIENNGGALVASGGEPGATSKGGIVIETAHNTTFYGAGAEVRSITINADETVTVTNGSISVTQRVGTTTNTVQLSEITSTDGIEITGAAERPTIGGTATAGTITFNSGTFATDTSLSGGTINGAKNAENVWTNTISADYTVVSGTVTVRGTVGTTTAGLALTGTGTVVISENTTLNAVSAANTIAFKVFGTLNGTDTTAIAPTTLVLGPNAYVKNVTIPSDAATTVGGEGVSNTNVTSGQDYYINGIPSSPSVGDAILSSELTIPAGTTFTVTGNLGLNGHSINVEGTLVVDNRATIYGTGVDGESIVLGEKGTITNNGSIGAKMPVTVSNGADQEVEIVGVSGVSFGYATFDDEQVLVISGDVRAVSGPAASTITLSGAGIGSELVIGRNVTLDVGTSTDTVKNATVTINGTMKGTSFVLNEGSTFTSNGAIDTVTVTALTGTYDGRNGAFSPSEDSPTFTISNIKGVTIYTKRVTVADSEDTEYFLRAYVNGTATLNTDVAPVQAGTNCIFKTEGEVYIASGETLTITEDVFVNMDNVVVQGTIVTEDGLRDAAQGESTPAEAIVYTGAAYETVVTGENNTETYTGYYTTLAAAMEAIGSAYENTVYVNVATIDINVTVAADQTLDIVSAEAPGIAADAVVTVEAEGAVTGMGIGKVDGKLVVEDGASCAAPSDYDVMSTSEDLTVTYAGFAVAIAEAQPGDVITVSKGTIGDSDSPATLTVPNGVTVNVIETLTITGNLTVAEGSTLTGGEIVVIDPSDTRYSRVTVNGTLDLSEGSLNVSDNATVTSTGSAIFAVAPTNFNGAYYLDADGNTVVTTVAKAVAYVTENDGDAVNVKGKVSESGALTLDGVNLVIDATAEVVLGDITLNDATVTATGAKLTANVTAMNGEGDAAANGTVTLSASGAALASSNVTSAAGVTTYTYAINAISGTMTVQSGTVAITGTPAVTSAADANAKLTVASGATLVVTGTLNVNGTTNLDFVVDGTLNVTDNGTVEFGALNAAKADTNLAGVAPVINGTMNIDDGANVNATALVINGTVNIIADETSEGTFTVEGAGVAVGDVKQAMGSTGSIVGAISFGKGDHIIAYAGTDMSGATRADNNEFETTAFYVNDALYATVYAATSTVNDVIGDDEVRNIPGIDKDKDKTITWTDAEGNDIADIDAFMIGTSGAVYAKAPLDQIKIKISVGTGISLYVDNVKIVSETYDLTIGTHTVSATVNPGYAGEVTISFNGQTVTGGSIEITVDSEGAVLSALGDISVDTGSTSGGDSGMGLTEILLVILVILIVVMAIMVALRLMRS